MRLGGGAHSSPSGPGTLEHPLLFFCMHTIKLFVNKMGGGVSRKNWDVESK